MQIPQGNQTRSGFVPAGIYTAILVDVNNAPSARNKTPQSVLKFQIVSPETVEFGDQTCKVAGVAFEIRCWWSEAAAPISVEMCAALGVPVERFESTEELQAALIAMQKAQLHVDVALESLPRYMRKTLTPAQIKAGVKPDDAELVVDPEGNPVIRGYTVNCRSSDIRPGTAHYPDPDRQPF